jgi:hypothetical protein
MRGSIVAIAVACCVASVPAAGLVRHVFILAPTTDVATYDRWYLNRHASEARLGLGPWLRRYETYRALPVAQPPARFQVGRYRLTELWYGSMEEWHEADGYRRRYSPAPRGPVPPADESPSAEIIVPAAPTEVFVRGFPPQDRAPFFRWVMIIGYPDGVTLSEGDRWYTQVHAPEAAKLPGLLRFVSHRRVEDSPRAGRWIRLTEMWFQNEAAWRSAVVQQRPAFTRPAWGGEYPFVEVVSFFASDQPDQDLLRNQ